MNNERKHQAWNFWSAFVFFGLVALVGFLLRKKQVDITGISFREALVLVLATYRLTRIVVFEKIFKYLRDFMKRRQDYYAIGTICSIITCPWCAGVWVTLFVVFLYYIVPFGDLLVYILALAGVASLFILISNMMHMRTESMQGRHRQKKSTTDI